MKTQTIKSMKTIITVIVLSLFLCSCDASDRSIQILRDQNYKNIEITGINLLACSEDDIFRYNFRAVNGDGKPVRGVVCSAPLKGYTIRFFPN